MITNKGSLITGLRGELLQYRALVTLNKGNGRVPDFRFSLLYSRSSCKTIKCKKAATHKRNPIKMFDSQRKAIVIQLEWL